nr:MAG TPA: hypothetical protein [Caudoviricetes sp.]
MYTKYKWRTCGSSPLHSQMFLRIVIFNCSTTPIRFVRIV